MPTGFCVSSAFLVPILPQFTRSIKTRQPLGANHAVSSTRVVPARVLPPAGRLPARPALQCHATSCFAAGASRHPHDPGAPVPRLSSSSFSLSRSFSLSGMERGMLALPRLRRSWRSRHRTPLRHTGLTALQWPLARPAPSALEAPQHQCPARFQVLRPVCISLSVPTILLSSQRVVCRGDEHRFSF